jgi:hypothetical protein
MTDPPPDLPEPAPRHRNRLQSMAIAMCDTEPTEPAVAVKLASVLLANLHALH